jgi:hypothetical protein
MIAISAATPDESFPVLVEGFDAACGRVVFAESDDLFEMRFEGLVKLAHGHVVSALGTPQDAPDSVKHGLSIGGVQHGSQLLDELIGASQLTVELKERTQPATLLVAAVVPGAQNEPASPATDLTKLGASSEEDRILSPCPVLTLGTT